MCMASESLAGGDNRDWSEKAKNSRGEICIVYTRKNRKDQIPAAAAAVEPVIHVASADAESPIYSAPADSVLGPGQGEVLGGQDGKISGEQPRDSGLMVRFSSRDMGRLQEEPARGSGGGEAGWKNPKSCLQEIYDAPTSVSGQETQLQQEPLSSSAGQIGTGAGQTSGEEVRPLPNGREELHSGGGGGETLRSDERHVNHGTVDISRNGLSKPLVRMVEDRVMITLSESSSIDEIRRVKRKLESELNQVRRVVKKVEDKVGQVATYTASNMTYSGAGHTGGGFGNLPVYDQQQLRRVDSFARSIGYLQTRPFRHLNVSVMGNDQEVSEFVEKEKRTPKANQYYTNSEFLLAKDRLPPKSNKKSKVHRAGKKYGLGGGGYVFGHNFGINKKRDKVYKNCSNLLQRLMKHKYACWFNEPVDVVKLGVPDYHYIIKHPMDFGTIKTRLTKNWYKSAMEFAEDVRLVFRNAMTYNPKGHDVHTMAEELLAIFEDRWTSIEKGCFPNKIYNTAGYYPFQGQDHPLPPTYAPITIPAPARPTPPMKTFDSYERIDSRLRPSNPSTPRVGRMPAPKKPKAKDPNKREMTNDEKQKLSANLQKLPPERLDAIVQIIKKRNSSVNQRGDEIEVDIDSVDTETLWELDRFVTNFRKSLSKYRRKAELAQQARAAAAQAVLLTNPEPASLDAQKGSTEGGNIHDAPVQVEEQGANVSASSSSSDSSSDSGSSSSDSDSDSSSTNGSDDDHSPRA